MKIYRIVLVVILVSALIPSANGYTLTGTYQNTNGDMVNIENFEGTPLLIEAIQTRCEYCNDASHRSNMNVLYNNFNDQINFLMVGVFGSDTLEELDGFINQHAIKWPAGLDINNAIRNQLAIGGTPTEVLLDGDGNVISKWEGGYLLDAYVDAINDLVETPVTISSSSDTTGGVGGGSGSDSSIIGDIFGNPIFQVGLVGILVLMVYFRSTKSA